MNRNGTGPARSSDPSARPFAVFCTKRNYFRIGKKETTCPFLGIFEGDLLEDDAVAAALRVDGKHDHTEGDVRLEVGEDEPRLGGRDVVPRRPGGGRVQLEEELLREAAVEAGDAVDLDRTGRLVPEGAVLDREGFSGCDDLPERTRDNCRTEKSGKRTWKTQGVTWWPTEFFAQQLRVP